MNQKPPAAPTLSADGFTYRDLNKNGRLDVYEDPRRSLPERVEDLLQQMTLEEKAGLMFHTVIATGMDGSLVEEPTRFSPLTTSDMVLDKHMNHFNVHAIGTPANAARWHNNLQQLAERTRLGIPVTLSSDPRHAFTKNPWLGMATAGFSLWCEPIGLAAANDPELTRQFGDIARQEYIAVGIRVALHPMADLATEPRWARVNGTFGEDARRSAQHTAAYIRGFQGNQVGKTSVACMTKHFPGGGPQWKGEDAHFPYGKEQVYPGNNFDYHLIPFEAAFAAGTAQIMPYYGQPIGTELEEVGFSYNKQVITGMLRGKYGFEGIVCTDWMLINDAIRDGRVFMEARAWGVEHLTPLERAAKILDAGVDQFGGEECPELIVELVHSGRINQARLDQSIRRLLAEKFRLGLFDNPYVDEEAAAALCGNPQFMAAGALAQRKSIVLLKKGDVLPLTGTKRLYVEGIETKIAARYGEVVDTPRQAEFAILRLGTPFTPREGILENIFHAGTLAFEGEALARILDVMAQVPTIVCIILERPAVIPEIAQRAAGLLADFGAEDTAVLDVVFGRFAPAGTLPFELPSSMEAVEKQKEDLPYDSENPLFPFGFGLTY